MMPGVYQTNSTLKAALEAHDLEAAIIIVQAINPPQGLEPVKDQALAILQAI